MGHGAIILEGMVRDNLSNMIVEQSAEGTEGESQEALWRKSDSDRECNKYCLICSRDSEGASRVGAEKGSRRGVSGEF